MPQEEWMEETPTSRTEIELQMVDCGHNHIDRIIQALETGAAAHMLMHIRGVSDGHPTHDMLMEDMDKAENALVRARNAMWS